MILKDMITCVLMCVPPMVATAPVAPACGHFPPSSWSDPIVTSQPGITLAASTGAMQHSLMNKIS